MADYYIHDETQEGHRKIKQNQCYPIHDFGIFHMKCKKCRDSKRKTCKEIQNKHLKDISNKKFRKIMITFVIGFLPLIGTLIWSLKSWDKPEQLVWIFTTYFTIFCINLFYQLVSRINTYQTVQDLKLQVLKLSHKTGYVVSPLFPEKMKVMYPDSFEVTIDEETEFLEVTRVKDGKVIED